MPICPNCQELTATADLIERYCPRCAAEQLSESRDGGWVSVARVANLAEAGYLVNRLADDEVAAQLVESESFSVLSGTWSNSYTIQVDAESADAARKLLQTEAELLAHEEPEFDADGEPLQAEPVHLVIWRPVALMAVAGFATLWLGQRAADPRPRAVPNRNAAALGLAIEAVGKPFVVTGDEGQLQYRLQYRAANRTWCLDSDTDGDGKLDRRQQFVIEAEPARFRD